MEDPKTLDELYSFHHSTSFWPDPRGSSWENKNFYPGSEEVRHQELRAEQKGRLATEVSICPFWEELRDCATLAGIDVATIPSATHFCGRLMPLFYSPHGPQPDPYASCFGLVLLLADQLQRATTKSPPSWQIEQAHKEPPKKRDEIFRRFDIAQSGKRIAADLVNRVAQVSGQEPRSQSESVTYARAFLDNFSSKIMGKPNSTTLFYHLRGAGACPVAPDDRW